MGKNLRFLSILLLIMVAGGLAWYAAKPNEPVYHGKSVTRWLTEYTDERFSGTPDDVKAQQTEAIKQFGTNAIPTLLRLLQTKDTPMASNLIFWLNKQSFRKFHLCFAGDYRWFAVNGFEVLGPVASPAVPVLTNLLYDPQLHWVAALSLGGIGPESRCAAPILITWLTNSDRTTRYCGAKALADIGPGAIGITAELFQHLNDTNEFVRNEIELALAKQKAFPEILVPMLTREINDGLKGKTRYWPVKIEALGDYSDQATSAVPLLLHILTNRFEPTEQARTALKQIDPEAALKAGIK